LKLKAEQRLRVFENRMLRRIVGSREEELAGGWRKLHNVKLRKLYSLGYIIRMMESRMSWTEHVASMGEIRNAYKILVGKFEGKRQLGRLRCRWKYIKMGLKKMGWEGVD
jgi:hypothetical protein